MSWLHRQPGGPALFHRRLRCSFCRRTEQQVQRLVAGAAGYICDACVTECVSILQERGGFDCPSTPAGPH